MTTYLGFVHGGVCRDTHAPTKDEDGKPIRVGMIRKQLWVKEALCRQGIDAWCGTRVEFQRRGKKREWERHDVPALPNYLVMDMTPEQMVAALQVKHLAPTFAVMSRAALYGVPATDKHPAIIGLAQFKAAVEADFRAADRVDANSRASVTEYKAGQLLRVVTGPFVDMLVTFDRLIRAPHDRLPRIEAQTESGLMIQFDPLDLKRA